MKFKIPINKESVFSEDDSGTSTFLSISTTSLNEKELQQMNLQNNDNIQEVVIIEGERNNNNNSIAKSNSGGGLSSLSPAASSLLLETSPNDKDKEGDDAILTVKQSSSHDRLLEPLNFLEDDPKTMTWSRRIALCWSKKYRWYNPYLKKIYHDVVDDEEEKRGDEFDKRISTYDDLVNVSGDHSQENPSIEVAWAYYEHMTLPRRLIPSENSNAKDNKNIISKIKKMGKKKLSVAVPGEMNYKTKLYNPWTTPMSQMGDFGLGVGLYFGTLRAFALLLFLAGILNISNIIYFSDKEYSNGQKDLLFHLKGSAACNFQEWVPCPNCSAENSGLSRVHELPYRLQTITNDNGQTMTVVLKNLCKGATFRVGMIVFGTILLFVVGMVLLAGYLKKKEVEFDLDEQTAQDYSISILNPPDDASDPEEWRDYFKNNFPDCNGMHVTSCTVARDNDELLDCLTKRRELIENLKDSLPNVNDIEDMEELSKTYEEILKEGNIFKRKIAKMFGIPSKVNKLVKLNEQIKVLVQMDHPVTSVFIMFETEMAQRHVLEKLTVSKANIKKNNVNALSNPGYLFRDNLVLDVVEAEEPSTIRWKELHVTSKDIMVTVTMTIFVFGIIAAVAVVVNLLNEDNENLALLTVSVSNAIFPTIAKMLSNIEKHSREEHRQVWLYVKIAVFRWVNTAVVTTLIMVRFLCFGFNIKQFRKLTVFPPM